MAMEMLSDHQYSLPLFLMLIAVSICSWTYYRRCLFPEKGQKHKSCMPTNWPVVGMLPAVMQNYHHLHDYCTDALFESGGTATFKGPWFSNSDMLITCNPENFHHILSRNFPNYPKGPEFRKIFDILGDGIFSTDNELWKIHREVNLPILHHPEYLETLQDSAQKKLGQGLLPMLETYASRGILVDLQDIFHRFTFDVFSMSLLGDDPGSLSVDLPSMPIHFAFLHLEEALMQRHVKPEWFWNLQRRVGFGLERKLRDGMDVIDKYIYRCMEKPTKDAGKFDILNALVNAYTEKSLMNSSTVTRPFIRDVVLALLLGGRDSVSTTLSWFFFLLAKNPGVEAKILREIGDLQWNWNQMIIKMNEYSPKLIYLHAAICETLRLYPPVALNHKAPVKSDILPCGASVNRNTKLVMSYYSTGRMESVWGKDCLEFKPERWITEQGRMRHVASYKFPAFNSGPRTCLGKDITFTVVKMVAVSLICNYHVELVQDHPVSPSNSIVIHMKHGLKVRLSKRN